ncbi:MAG: NAD(P)H-binding protein [Dehalococcoidia bacterium]|nr:NAD(P)H-binding protein [Dehalococcoidia bacterium]
MSVEDPDLPDLPDLNVVTGAFGYTGRYVAGRLLSMGARVRTLTGHPERHNPFGHRVSVAPLNFEDPPGLTESLRGATTLYNTYWIRFAHGRETFERAVANSLALIGAAKDAGVSRIVHISITNPSHGSPFPYFKGKSTVEQAIIDSGLSYAIVRPALIFGLEDILINNIAWLLRRFPIFIVPGKGDCLLQPVDVEDLAQLATSAGRGRDNVIFDAVGPETHTFDQLVRLIAETVKSRARVVHLGPGAALLASRVIGLLVRDAMLTRDEVEGLNSNLLVSQQPATGSTKLSVWLRQNGEHIGAAYASELRRHYR